MKYKASRVDLQVTLQPNTFINADCMDYLTKCPTNYFQLAIVDPPYGHGDIVITNNKTRNNATKATEYYYSGYNKTSPPYEYFSELFRISENQIIWGENYYKHNWAAGRIVWDKDNTGDFSDCEIAFQSFSDSVRKFKYRWNGMLQENMKEKEERIHPNQKPVALYRWLLKKYGKAGDLILDTHVGSASSLIACKELGFDYVGFEIDKEYYEQAEKRLSRAFRKYELDL